MKKLAVILSSFSIFLGSCTSYQYTAKGFTKSNINKMDYVGAYSDIALVAKRNIPVYNDSVTGISQNLIDSILNAKKKDYKLSGMILNNDSNSKKVEYGIFKLLHQLTNTLRCDTVKMDKQLQQFIQKSGSDYVLMLVVRGYTRTKADKNYKIAQAVLTLGTQVAESFKGSTTIYLAIADKRTNQIVYYDRLENKDSDPLRRPDMEGQLNSIITKLYN